MDPAVYLFREALSSFSNSFGQPLRTRLNKFRRSLHRWTTFRQRGNKTRRERCSRGARRMKARADGQRVVKKDVSQRREREREREKKRERKRKRRHREKQGKGKNPIVQYPRLELKLFVSLPDAGMPIAGVLGTIFLRTAIGRINTAYQDYPRRRRRRSSTPPPCTDTTTAVDHLDWSGI